MRKIAFIDHGNIALFAGLAVLSAFGRDVLPLRDTTCRYREPAGPPAPVSRQVRRALERQAQKARAQFDKLEPNS